MTVLSSLSSWLRSWTVNSAHGLREDFGTGGISDGGVSDEAEEEGRAVFVGSVSAGSSW